MTISVNLAFALILVFELVGLAALMWAAHGLWRLREEMRSEPHDVVTIIVHDPDDDFPTE